MIWNRTVVVAAIALVAVVSLSSTPAHAQYRNAGVQVNVGVLNLGSWDWIINGGKSAAQHLDQANGKPDPGWNLYEEPTIGMAGYGSLGYDLWLDAQAAFGAWTTILDHGNPTPIGTLQVSTGLRYNFLEERLRPFVEVQFEYLWLLGVGAATPVPANSFLGSNMFIGGRVGGGLEYFFADEMSFNIEVAWIGFIVPDTKRGLGGLFLPSSTARLGYNIYF